ncbi:DUF1801 domain-containing protein [Microbacterium pumilum]|uniref:Iron chaperone n=1 Tax=Microbacterium pumilum TaxID=344165 RepID=A0ABN2SLI9_9MICO
MAAPTTVDAYIASFPPDVAERLERIRGILVDAVAESGVEPEQKIRYGIGAVMLGGRYAIHFAGWKKHIGLYPVGTLDEPLEGEVAPYRAEKDSVVFLHRDPVPYELIARVAEAVVAKRGAGAAGKS